MAHGLNAAQAEAVNTLRGPMLVLAGAGTGKTRVVTFRIANLIRKGCPAEQILGVTFTNKAALEMQQRIVKIVGKKAAKPRLCTFHSHCVQVLRRHIQRLGYPEKFSILDRGDQESIARAVLREIRVPTAVLKPGDLINSISGWKSRSLTHKDAATMARTDKEHLAAAGYRRYQNTLRQRGVVDFDDLLLFTEELLTNDAEVRQVEQNLFRHLLIDEYQDTNGCQYRIVKLLAGGHRNLCVVGDDDQSIYGWRGAEVEHILEFEKDWPDAKVIRLEENYRSTGAILEAANRVIAYNTNRHGKVLRPARGMGEKPRILQFPDETEEARQVITQIAREVSKGEVEFRDFAVLFRTNEQPRVFEQEFRRQQVPYILLGSSSFFDRAEVRDFLAFVVAADSQDETALRRIINKPPRGIGSKTIDTLIDLAVQAGKPMWEVLVGNDWQKHFTDQPRQALEGFVALIRKLHVASQQMSVGKFVPYALDVTRYRDEVNRQFPDPEEREIRLGSLEQVCSAAATYEKEEKKPTLRGFLDQMALADRSSEEDKEKKLARNAVALLTVHAAKGLEYPQVYMVGMEEGILPHSRSLEEDYDDVSEERRLCYVGMTRAQERLTMTLALTRMKWGKPRETLPSRFLFEVTGQSENANKYRQRARAHAKKMAAGPKKTAKPASQKTARSSARRSGR